MPKRNETRATAATSGTIKLGRTATASAAGSRPLRRIGRCDQATLRVATPVFADDGTPFGIFMINVDMELAFDRVRSAAWPGETIYVVNRHGDYLVHPDRSREFGTQTGKPHDWKADFPQLASRAGARQGSAEIVPDPAAGSGGIALAPALLAGAEWIGVIETTLTPSSWRPPQVSETRRCWSERSRYCAAAGDADRTVADPTDRAADQGGRRSQRRKGHYSGRCPRRNRRAMRAFAQAIDDDAKTAALQQEVQDHRHTIAARDHHAAREQLFSAAVESSNDAIITMSLDGTINGWNSAAERLFGYTAAEAAARNITLLVPDDRLPEVQDTLRRIGWGESIEHNETVRLRKDGRRIEVSLSISPIKAPSGAIIGISKVARDITDDNRPGGCCGSRARNCADIRDLAGSDRRDGCARFRVQISPLRSHTGISAGGDARTQRGRLHSSRPSRKVCAGRGTAWAADADFRHALHAQERAEVWRPGSNLVRSRSSASSSAAT